MRRRDELTLAGTLIVLCLIVAAIGAWWITRPLFAVAQAAPVRPKLVAKHDEAPELPRIGAPRAYCTMGTIWLPCAAIEPDQGHT